MSDNYFDEIDEMDKSSLLRKKSKTAYVKNNYSSKKSSQSEQSGDGNSAGITLISPVKNRYFGT